MGRDGGALLIQPNGASAVGAGVGEGRIDDSQDAIAMENGTTTLGIRILPRTIEGCVKDSKMTDTALATNLDLLLRDLHNLFTSQDA